MAVDSIAPVGARDESNMARYLPPSVGNTNAQKPGQLPEDAKKEVEDLKKRDREVRQHELAHMIAGGQYVRGGPTYTYKIGPDGRRYAVGGEVQIDTSEIPDDPEATLKKMQVVERAALAPKDPSGQDYRVAAQARQQEMKARAEIARQKANPDTAGDKSAEEPKASGVDIQI